MNGQDFKQTPSTYPASSAPSQPGQAAQQPTGQTSQPSKQAVPPDIEKKYCTECGKEMKLNQKGEWFCPDCGFKLTQAPDTKAFLSRAEKRKRLIMTIVKISLLVAAGGCAVFIVKHFFKILDSLGNLF